VGVSNVPNAGVQAGQDPRAQPWRTAAREAAEAGADAVDPIDTSKAANPAEIGCVAIVDRVIQAEGDDALPAGFAKTLLNPADPR
jgi:hypothetical protein